MAAMVPCEYLRKCIVQSFYSHTFLNIKAVHTPPGLASPIIITSNKNYQIFNSDIIQGLEILRGLEN